MGNRIKKSEDDELRQEYFKIIKHNFDEGIKRINNKVHMPNNDEYWAAFLNLKITEYYEINKNTKLLKILSTYINTTNDSEDAKHVYNLNIFLTKETNEELISNYNKSKALL
jgi:hypothetical protein